MTRGFLTVATGEKYRRLARNLLRSYRRHCPKPLPFALISDRWEGEFDRCILLPEPRGDYLDKLEICRLSPFEETIFLDADCLAYGDLNEMFRWFRDADDVSCHGRVLPLTDKTGWFDYENLGPWQSRVSYCLGLHGGLYYFRKTPRAQRVFQLAGALAADYEKFRFRGNFPSPGDEPLMALAMAVEGCRPIPCRSRGIRCFWEDPGDFRLDMRKGRAFCGKEQTILVHFGTRYTDKLRYRLQAAQLGRGGHG